MPMATEHTVFMCCSLQDPLGLPLRYQAFESFFVNRVQISNTLSGPVSANADCERTRRKGHSYRIPVFASNPLTEVF
jgi:hypothetical protein